MSGSYLHISSLLDLYPSFRNVEAFEFPKSNNFVAILAKFYKEAIPASPIPSESNNGHE